MLSIKKQIPNMITAMNLLSGVLSIVICLSFGNIKLAACLIVLGAVFDFFDGMVARLLGVSSPIGKDLDSLADIVSFGVAPSILIFKKIWMLSSCPWSGGLALLIAIFAGFRLAKFNNDTRQTNSFIGLPVPANAIFWIGFALSTDWISETIGLYPSIYTSYVLVILIGWLMISELPMFSFKIKAFQKEYLLYPSILIVISILSILFFQYLGLSLTILAYILLSIVQNQLKK